MSNQKKCLLCYRIPFEDILSYSHKIWKDGKVANRIATVAAAIIRESYLISPSKTCGKKPTAILAAALYIASIITGNRATQSIIAKNLNVTEVAIRNNVRNFKRIIPVFRSILTSKNVSICIFYDECSELNCEICKKYFLLENLNLNTILPRYLI